MNPPTEIDQIVAKADLAPFEKAGLLEMSDNLTKEEKTDFLSEIKTHPELLKLLSQNIQTKVDYFQGNSSVSLEEIVESEKDLVGKFT